jgi:hypothetical protein
VVGHADTELIDPEHPFADANRRISILVLARNTSNHDLTPESKVQKMPQSRQTASDPAQSPRETKGS